MLPDVSKMIPRNARKNMRVMFVIESGSEAFNAVGIDEPTGKTCVCFVMQTEDGQRFMGTLFTKQTFLDILALKGRNLSHYVVTGKFSKAAVTGNGGETYCPIIGEIKGIA